MPSKKKPASKKTATKKAAPDKDKLAKAAQVMLNREMTRVIKKSEAGKPLTDREMRMLEKLVPEEEQEEPRFVKNQSELAKALDVDRKTILLWRKSHDTPEARPDGRYNIDEWRVFVKRYGLGRKGVNLGDDPNTLGGEDGLEDKETLQRKKLALENEQRQLKIDIEKGFYIQAELVQESWTGKVAEASSLMRNKLENELPPVIAGMDAADIRKEMMTVIDEICQILHNGGTDSGE